MISDLESWYIHAIFRPFVDVLRRSTDDVAFRPKFNDLSITVGKICTACMHLPERVESIEAQKVRGFSAYMKLSDIANTEKHVVRKVSSRQAELSTRAMFILTESGNFRFLRNQVIATCPAWGEIDAIEMIGSFINEIIGHFNFNGGNTVGVEIKARPEQKIATLRAEPQSLPMDGVALYFVELTSNGGFKPVDPLEVRFQVLADPALEGCLSNVGSDESCASPRRP